MEVEELDEEEGILNSSEDLRPLELEKRNEIIIDP